MAQELKIMYKKKAHALNSNASFTTIYNTKTLHGTTSK